MTTAMLEGEGDVKLIRLRDYKFFNELIKDGGIFAGCILGKQIFVVAEVGLNNGWLAYYETPDLKGDLNGFGNIMPAATAARIFPGFARKYNWNPSMHRIKQ